MPQFHAQMPTPRALRNMTRLCKHFAHKADVTITGSDAHCSFAFGQCYMHATEVQLLIDCQAETDEAQKRLRFVLADHLYRFSGEEALQIDWRDGPLPTHAADA